MEKYFDEESIFKKSTPLHVKGALIHNRIIRDLDLPYNEIYSGDRVRVLKVIPTRPKYTSICFKEELPKEFITDFQPNLPGIIKTDFLQKVEKLVGAFNWDRILTNLIKILNRKDKGWLTYEEPLSFEKVKEYIDEMIKGSS